MAKRRKTVTSCEVKDRWNRAHYDMISIRTGKGGREAVQALAAARGMSMAAYIRHCIIQDANTMQINADISAILGGGGHLSSLIDKIRIQCIGL